MFDLLKLGSHEGLDGGRSVCCINPDLHSSREKIIQKIFTGVYFHLATAFDLRNPDIRLGKKVVLLATIDIKYGQAGLSKTTLEIYLRCCNM